MDEIERLLARVAADERSLRNARILAPSVPGGRVRVKVSGLVHSFVPRPEGFEGWGVFCLRGNGEAEFVEEPTPANVARYLDLLRPLRFRLVHPLRARTWLGYPANESDARQRGWRVEPVPMHLVSGGGAFEQVLGRSDGSAWWFEDLDRRADPRLAETLHQAFRASAAPGALRRRGLTPELRVVYDLAAQQAPGFGHLRDERRLRDALALGGGSLHAFRDEGDLWCVEWNTADGARHTSAIAKRDLSVVSAGICLADRDRDFDLQLLVGVVQRSADEDW